MKRFVEKYVLGGWYPLFWIGGISYLLYTKTLAFRFTFFDDNLLILNNYWFLKDAGNLLRAFRESVFLSSDDTFYRPLLTLSLMLDAQIGGISPAAYHLTNICLHALAAVLLFVLFSELSFGKKTSFFAAILFAVHPALSQAVAWIPGRNDSLLAVFVLASFIVFLRFMRTGGKRYLAAHALFVACALLTKETAVLVIPLCAVFLAMTAREGFPGKTFIKAGAAWGAPLLVFVVLRSAANAAGPGGSFNGHDYSLPEMGAAFIQYLGKAVFPFNLSVYPLVRDTTLAYGFIALALLAAVPFLLPPRRPRIFFFGLAWFLLFLAPPFLLPDKCRLEHRLYLPVAGLFVALAELDRKRLAGRFMAPAAACVVVLFAAITFIHEDRFIGGMTFWKSAAASSPHSSTAYNELALRYRERGEDELSRQALLKAVMLSPGNVNAHTNLGILYTDRGAYADAEKAFRTAELLKPGNEITLYNYGLLRYREGKTAEAERAWERAFEQNPNFLYACRALAALYYVSGNAERYARCAALLKDRFHYPLAPVTDPSLRDPERFYRFNRQDEAWKAAE